MMWRISLFMLSGAAIGFALGSDFNWFFGGQCAASGIS